jgi:hypothetical protein
MLRPGGTSYDVPEFFSTIVNGWSALASTAAAVNHSKWTRSCGRLAAAASTAFISGPGPHV